MIGYKLFGDGDFDKSLIHLKKAEANLQYCDSMSSFVYSIIVSNTMTTDTILALNYAHKALKKDLEYNLFPVKDLGHGTAFLCSDCLSNDEDIAWCKRCGEPFVMLANETNKKYCYDCREIMPEEKENESVEN